MTFDVKTWGIIKVVGGAVAFWWAWRDGAGANLAGAVAILAALTVLGGAVKAWGKGK